MQIMEMIGQGQRYIFDYDISQVPTQIIGLMTAIIDQAAFDIQDGKKLQLFNQLMEACLKAMQDQDYLLLADIMEYRLKPFLDQAK